MKAKKKKTNKKHYLNLTRRVTGRLVADYSDCLSVGVVHIGLTPLLNIGLDFYDRFMSKMTTEQDYDPDET